MVQTAARFITRFPRWVLAFWLSQLALALPLAAQVGSVLTAQPDPPPDTTGGQVQTLLQTAFERSGDETLVLLVEPEPGLTIDHPTVLDRYRQLLASLLALDGLSLQEDFTTETRVPLAPPGGGFGVAFLRLEDRPFDEEIALVREVRRIMAATESLDLAISGGPASVDEAEAVSERDTRRAEIYGLPLSLLVLIVAFGALLAAGLPLLVAITSITLSLAGLFVLGQVVEFAVFIQSVVTVLALATGIDYALLMVSRFREELRTHFDPRLAAERTALSAGRSVAFSGITVILALTALLIPSSTYIRSIGIGAMFVIFVSVLVSTTALPALLALLGHRVNWLRVTRREPGLRSRRFWHRQALAIMSRPRLFLTVGVLVLVLLSLPALSMKLSDPGPFGLGEKTDSRRTVEALKRLGLSGALEPVDILVDFGDRGFFHPSNVRAVAAFVRAVEELEQVAAVVSPVSLSAVPKLLLYQYLSNPETARASELSEVVAATVSLDDRYALVQAIPPARLPPAESAALLGELRTLVSETDLPALIGGYDVRQAEWAAVLYRDFPLALGVVYLATLVLLGLAFKSLLIPIKSIVLNTLTVGAAYGVLTLVSQLGVAAPLLGFDGGLGFVDTTAPLFIFAIVFGLSMDYEVFLVARMIEAHERGLPDRDAVASALASTGGVITSAAAIMIVVFSTFIFSEVVLIKTLGIGLTVAILLDATLVRVVLVPSVMVLAGRWNWWLPRPIARWAANVDLRHE